ncbi:MAG: hypothetical protein AB1742_13105 [bacterium]
MHALFIHVVKEYTRKLEEIDRRLEVSLDKEEIQTLGLKLRFHYNELKHYSQLLRSIHDRVVHIQEKYGFLANEEVSRAKEEPPPGDEKDSGKHPPAPEFTELTPPAVQPPKAKNERERKDLVALVSQWAERLAENGLRIEDVLKDAGTFPAGAPPGIKAPEKTKPEDARGGAPPEKPAPPVPEEEEPVESGFAGEGAGDEPAHARERPPSVETLPLPPVPPLEEKIAEWSSRLASGDTEKTVGEIEKYAAKNRAALMEWTGTLLDESAAAERAGAAPAADVVLGVLAALSGATGAAINFLESAMKKGADHPFAHLYLAHCFMVKKLYEGALANYRLALRRDPANPNAVFGAADSLMRLKRFDETLKLLERDFPDRKSRLEAGLLRAEAEAGLGNYNAALNTVQALLEDCDSMEERSRCYHAMGRVKNIRGDVLSSIDLLERSLEADSMNPAARLDLGKLYHAHNAVPLAKNHFTFLVRNFPETEWADEARAYIYRVPEAAKFPSGSPEAKQPQRGVGRAPENTLSGR